MGKFVLLVLACAASASAAPIAPVKPNFCAGHTPEADRNRYLETTFGSEGLSDNLINRVAMDACDAPDEPARQQHMATYRQAMVDRWGFTPEMTLEALRIRLDMAAFKKETDAFCRATHPASDASDRENAGNWAWGKLVGCDHSGAIFFFLDEQAEAPQVWRLAQVLSCYEPGRLDKFDEPNGWTDKMKKSTELTRYARCGVDARRLDRAKLTAELAADARVTPRVKAQILETFDQEKAWTDRVTAAYKALAARSAPHQEILFDLPEKAIADWQATYDGTRADFDQVLSVERKAPDGKSALRGCGAKLRPAFARFLQAHPAKSKKEIETLAMDPWGYRWVRALALCEQAEDNGNVARCLSYNYSGKGLTPGGPRWAAEQAAAARVAEQRADSPRFSDDSGSFWMLGEADGAKGLEVSVNANCVGGSGTIATMKKLGEHTAVTFKTVSWIEPTYACKSTGRISRVDFQSGRVEYQQNCHQNGTQKLSSTEDPIAVPTFYAGGLKVGQFLTFVGGTTANGSEPRAAMPMLGFTDAKQTKAVSALGVPLR